MGFSQSTTNQSGMFSTDGIIQSGTTNNTFVQCSTTHLTSFAVLADISGVSVIQLVYLLYVIFIIYMYERLDQLYC